VLLFLKFQSFFKRKLTIIKKKKIEESEGVI
jgi:hypothetical protein